MRRLLIPCLLLLVFASSCTHRMFSARTLAPETLATHRTVAILPFDVEFERIRLSDMAACSGHYADSTISRLRPQWSDAQRLERRHTAYQLQEQLQAQLMRQQVKQPCTVTFQHPAETNRLLEKAGITYDNLPDRSMEEIRQALGVDAILSGQTTLHQPLPGGMNVALFIMSDGEIFAQNSVSTNLTIHDCHSGKLVWRFDHELTGKLDNSPATLVRNLVRNSGKTFPYFRKS
jgi:hypothetical protein